jgi:hypothetical protein
LGLVGYSTFIERYITRISPCRMPVRDKTYSSGLKASLPGTPVFISRGIDWAIYPVPLNCLPEIVVLELEPHHP